MADSDSCFVGCCTCLVALIVLGSFIGFPVTSIFLGAEYMNECPVEPLIPVFLIVLGAVTLAYEMVSILQLLCDKSERVCCSCCMSMLGWLLSLFFIGWIITGTVWYANTNSKRSGEPTFDDYCNYTLYAYFESQIILAYILLFFVVVLPCCRACCCRDTESGYDPEVSRIAEPRHQQHSLRSGQPLVWVYYQSVDVVYHRVDT